MGVWIIDSIENRQEDESTGSNNGENNGTDGQALLHARSVVRQSSLVSEPSF